MGIVRFATIGTNFIVDRFRRAAGFCAEFQLQAVYSRSRENGVRFAGDSSIKVYNDLAELGADPDVDAVYIASPTRFHAEQALQMIKAGKHVLCEKPAASNRHEWELMTAAAKQAGVVILEAMRPLFFPEFQIIKKALPKLGEIRIADFSFCKYSSRYDAFKAGVVENAFRPELSNGALMDIGIYSIESMLGLFGKPLKIESTAYILPGSIDGSGSIQAAYPGMISTLRYSKISDSLTGCEIQGEQGTLVYRQVEAPGGAVIHYRDGSVEQLCAEPVKDDMQYELQAFIDMINGTSKAEEYQQITCEALTITDQVRQQQGIVFETDYSGSTHTGGSFEGVYTQ